MAEPLKNYFGLDVPQQIAAMIQQVYPEFEREEFLIAVSKGYDALDLMPRARHISLQLRQFLPGPYCEALQILMASLDQKVPVEAVMGPMTGFVYLPHVFFVASFGLEDFEASMDAQYLLTQRLTAEFSIRAYLEKYPEATLAKLETWALDPNHHVRRLVSEGTRPRLPWAQRLPQFQRDPGPVLFLLEKLKDDPEEYVRRSVANNLNDIGKDNPEIMLDTCQRWMIGASPERKKLVQHALRSLVKAGDGRALKILGYERCTALQVCSSKLKPLEVPWEGTVEISADIFNPTEVAHRVLVDLCLHFQKANGTQTPKIFKLKSLKLEPGQTVTVSKKFSLQERTTRKHYPGTHRVQVQLNGSLHEVGSFTLLPPG